MISLELLILLAGLRLPVAATAAQEDEPVKLNWSLLGTFAGRATGNRPAGSGSDFVVAEERVRLEVSAGLDDLDLSFLARAEILHDAVDNDVEIDLREARADFRTGSFDFRLGRQVLTWGVGDLVFVNDVFPKDWVSFFTGRPIEYFKAPLDAFKAAFSSDAVNLEGIVAPFFQEDLLPESDRFLVFDPFPGLPRTDDRPKPAFGNTELALRVYRQIGETDVSLYVTRGFWKIPSLEPAGASVRVFHPPLNTYGASAQRNLLGGVASLEVGYYDSRRDRDGDDPLVPNSEIRFLLGYQREIARDFTAGIQYFVEWMLRHGRYRTALPAGFPEQDEVRHTVTFRLTLLLDYQAWKISLFALYGISESDVLLVPEVTYKALDRFSVTLSGRLFDGRRDDTRWGSLDGNDNVSVAIRFDF